MDDLVVTVKQGALRGKVVHNVRGGEYYSFKGIPYAKPPIRELRFKAPQPPDPWEGIRDATTHQGKSLQMRVFPPPLLKISGSEDCLYLNVYTPQKPHTNKESLKPVMVVIHGGAFSNGSGDDTEYGPDYFLKEDIILVTFNYRLGLLGFLKIDDPSLDAPGNAGLKDMVMALRWVNENIIQFGGDPNNVTVFGESAGGASAHFLILSPLAKGLFQKAIIQSGVAFLTWALYFPYVDYIPELLKLLNIQETDNAKILQKLREVPANDLLHAQIKMDKSLCSTRRFVPGIERTSKETAFLVDHPLNIIRSGEYNKVPLIFGYTSREGMLFLDLESVLSKKIEDSIPYKSTKIVEEIRKYYLGGKEIRKENINDLHLMFSDVYFVHGIYESLKEHLRNNSADIYLNRFSLDGRLNFLKTILNLKGPGACHGDDLGYLYRIEVLHAEAVPNSVEELTIKRMTKLWTNFAKYGNPNPKEPSELISVAWQPIKENKFHYLEIGENLTVGVNPDIERMKFWDNVLGAQ